MGYFLYGGHIPVEFDDRVMAHLEAVIIAKLRHGEVTVAKWVDGAIAEEYIWS